MKSHGMPQWLKIYAVQSTPVMVVFSCLGTVVFFFRMSCHNFTVGFHVSTHLVMEPRLTQSVLVCDPGGAVTRNEEFFNFDFIFGC